METEGEKTWWEKPRSSLEKLSMKLFRRLEEFFRRTCKFELKKSPADQPASPYQLEVEYADSQENAENEAGPSLQQQPSSHEQETCSTLSGLALKAFLLVSDRYGTSSGHVSTINRQVALLMKENGTTVYSTALHATEKDKNEALIDGIKLILPVNEDSDDDDDSDDEEQPCMRWLTKYFTVHYPHLPPDVDYLVGHVDISGLAKASHKIKKKRYTQAELILINHDIPEDTEGYKGGKEATKASEKNRKLVRMAKNSDLVFSVGSRVYNSFERNYQSLGSKKPKKHHIFLPRPSRRSERTHLEMRPVGSQKVVLSIGSVKGLVKQKGYDIAARTIAIVTKYFPNVRWCVRGISEDDWERTQQTLENLLTTGKLRPILKPCGTHSDIQEDFMTSDLFIMPSRCEPFGLDGLNAIAAGIPVLISDQSGLADLIMELIKTGKCDPDRRCRIVETSVRESDLETDAKRWAEEILDTLRNIEHEFAKAAVFKRELLESKYWEESHRTFLEACGITD